MSNKNNHNKKKKSKYESSSMDLEDPNNSKIIIIGKNGESNLFIIHYLEITNKTDLQKSIWRNYAYEAFVNMNQCTYGPKAEKGRNQFGNRILYSKEIKGFYLKIFSFKYTKAAIRLIILYRIQ